MSNVIVPLEHQSSPKETQIDKEIRLAQEEIANDQFRPLEPEDGWYTGTEGLAQHPRVIEALATLETQIQDKTNSEYLEKAQMFHELNASVMKERRWPGQRRWEGEEMEAMRKVNPMTPFQFIEKLERIGIRADREPTIQMEHRADENGILQMVEVQYTSAQVCLGKRVYNSCCGVFANLPGPDGALATMHVGTLQVPLGPEWDLIRFDEWGVPIGHRFRGWRTAVLGLITKGAITEEQAHQAFGKPIENEASAFYRQQLFDFRSGRG